MVNLYIMNVETLIYKNDHNPNPAVSSNEAHFRVSREFLRLLQTENFECFFFFFESTSKFSQP